MNQILLTDNEKNSRKNKYNLNDTGDIKKIIIFFSIAILIFALLIIGIYIYKMSKNRKEEAPIAKPELSLEQTENNLNIIAKAEAGISKIIYTWNDDEPIEIEMNGRKSNEEALEIPSGQNIITVKVIDELGQEIETNQEFYIEINDEKPKIEIDDTLGNGKLKIIAEDENNTIKYITYKWNNEEETTVEAEEDNQTILETMIDIRRGKNTLTITAVNGLAKSETIEKIFNGVNNPIIDVTRDENTIYMKITHDMGFKKIEYTINGQLYVYDENYSEYDKEQKEVSYKYDLIEGENTVVIHAISMENTEETYRGKCSYIVEQ